MYVARGRGWKGKRGKWKSVPTPQNNGLPTLSSDNTNRFKHRRVTIKKYIREKEMQIHPAGVRMIWLNLSGRPCRFPKKLVPASSLQQNQHECRQKKNTQTAHTVFAGQVYIQMQMKSLKVVQQRCYFSSLKTMTFLSVIQFKREDRSVNFFAPTIQI